MAKKRILVPILALILVLLMSVGLFVACDDDPQPVEYTVTFTQGDGTTSTVTVGEGTALTAEQIPEYLIAPGSHVAFDGWYVDATKIEAGYIPTANVTATAHTTNLFTVTFKNGDDVIKEVEVRDGAALTADDIPAFTPASGFAFDGWYAGQDKVEVGDVITANVIATPATTQLVTITFKNGAEVVKEVEVRAGAALAEENMPDDLQPALGFRFDGWYVDDVKVAVGYQVSANVEAQPRFADAMAGTYSDGMYNIVIDGAGNIKLVDYRQDEFAGTYTIVEGAIVADFEDDDLDTSYTIIEDGKVLTEEYYGDVVEYVKEGAEFDSHIQDFVGVWKYMDTTYGEPVETFIDISLDGESIVILVNGEDMPYTGQNYNGTKVSWYMGGNVLAFDNGVLKLNGEFECTKVDVATLKFTVSFELEDGTVVASQQVAYGQALNADELPSDADVIAPLGFAFDGWLNENDDPLDEEALVYANATYIAQFYQESIIVKFMNGEDEIADSRVAVAFDGGKLQASDIPAAVSGAEGEVFLGFYDAEGVKAAADVVPNIEYVGEVAYAIYNATFVNEASYTGRFVDGENGYYISFGEAGAVKGMGLSDTFEYDAETGAMKFSEGFGYSQESWTMLAAGDHLFVEHVYYDYSETLFTDKYTLARGEGGQFVGTYKCDNSKVMEVIEGDVVANVNGSSSVVAGKIVPYGGAYKIVYKHSLAADASETELPFSIDEKGNMVLVKDKGTQYETTYIYVKGVTEFKSFYNSAYGYIYEFSVDGAKTYVFECKADKVSYYCTVSGALDAATGEITVSYTDSEDKAQEMVIKISGTNYVAAAAERGTYTGAEGELYLDGFGAGKLADAAIEYSISGKGYAIIGEKAYVLAEDKTYTVLAQKDGYQGVFAQSGSTSYGFTFDGFGGVVLKVYSSEYPGSYTVNNEGTEMTIDSPNYSSFSGVYAICEEGNVLDRTAPSAKTFVKEGHELVDYLDDMVGYYEDADKNGSIEIVKVNKKVYIKVSGAQVFVATSNYNHSVFTITINSNPYTIAKDGAGIKCSETVNDQPQEISMSKVEKEVVNYDTTTIVGKWELFTESYYYSFDFSEDGNVTVVRSDLAEPKTATYTMDGNVATFSVTLGYYAEKHTCTLGNGILAISTGSYYQSPLGNAVKVSGALAQGGGEEVLDAFAGTWTADAAVNPSQYSFTFDGKGNLTISSAKYPESSSYNGTADYVIGAENTITVDCIGYTWTFKLNEDGSIYQKSSDMDGASAMDWGNLTKQAEEEQLDAFAGTWVNGDMSWTFDGKGSVVVAGANAGTYDYTVDATGKVATFRNTAYSENMTCTLQADGTMDVCDQYGDWLNHVAFTKKAA